MPFHQDEVRRYVQELKQFYKEIFVSCGIFLICIIAWMTTKGGGFWPLWVLIAFLTNLAFRAVSIGVLPKYSLFGRLTKFFNQEWEEKQIERFLHMHGEKRSNKRDLFSSSDSFDASDTTNTASVADEDPYKEQFQEGGRKKKNKSFKDQSFVVTDSKQQMRPTSGASAPSSPKRPNKNK